MAFDLLAVKKGTIENAFEQASVIRPEMYNPDYTGDMNYGTVKIDVMGKMTAIDHVKDETLANGTVTPTGESTLSVNVKVKDTLRPIDGADENNIGNSKQEAVSRATGLAHGTARDIEFITGLAKSSMASSVTITGALDSTTILAGITGAMQALDDAGAPSYGRFMLVTPAVKALILTNDRLTNVFTPAGAEALKSGIMGECLGFTLMFSNNLKEVDMGSEVKDLEFLAWQSEAAIHDFVMVTAGMNKNPNKVNTVNVEGQSRMFAELAQVGGAVISRSSI